MKTKLTVLCLFSFFALQLSAQNIIGLYPLNQNTLSNNYFEDVSGQENDALAHSVYPIFDPDRNGSLNAAVNLGSGSSMIINENADSPSYENVDQLSMGFWAIRIPTPVDTDCDDDCRIILSMQGENGNKFEIGFNEFHQIIFKHSGDAINYFTLESNVTFQNMEWFHVAISFDKTLHTAELYINGELHDSQNLFMEALENPILYFARTAEELEMPISFCLDDMVIYDGILSQKQFEDLYEGELIMTATENLISDVDLSIFPNPNTTDELFWASGLEIQKAQVYDLQGKLLLNTNTVNSNKLSISSLPSGTFIVRLLSEDGQVAYRKLTRI